MISKVTKGSGFRGVLMYIAGKQGAEYIGGNVSPNPKEAAREMGTLRQYSKCKTPVWHCSLSLSPEDRRLTNDEFAEIGERFLEKIGLTNHQYTIFRHSDRAHSHIHIVVNRVDLSPKHQTWNAWQDVTRAREAKNQIEQEYRLQVVAHNPQFACPEISRGEQEKARRARTIPARQYVAKAIATASQTANVRAFVKSLSDNGIMAVPNISNTGRMCGFSFVWGKQHYKGSQLKCSWASLKGRIGYDAERDIEFLLSLLPEDRYRTNRTEETRREEPRRKRTIYTMAEWQHMGGEKGSDYKRAYKMITDRYSLRDVAQEIKLHSPSMSEEQLRRILYRSGKLWIENNTDKLAWAYNSRRRYIRFSQDPAVMLLQVLALLISAAVKAILRDIEERHTTRQIDNLSQELRAMMDYAEKKAMRRLHTLERQERQREPERENPLLEHAWEMSMERSR